MADFDSIENKTLKLGRKRFKEFRECPAEKKYREDTNRDIKFFTGEDQGWDDDGARAKLKEEGRPAVTLNRVAPIIRLIQGARPEADARFSATEEGDVDTADILNAVKDHVENVNRWNFGEADWFRDGIVKNGAVVGIFPNYDKDIRGEIALNVEDRFKFYFDPNAKKRTRSDGEAMFIVESMSPDQAKRMWPKSKAKIDELADSSGMTQTSLFGRLLEWYADQSPTMRAVIMRQISTEHVPTVIEMLYKESQETSSATREVKGKSKVKKAVRTAALRDKSHGTRA